MMKASCRLPFLLALALLLSACPVWGKAQTVTAAVSSIAHDRHDPLPSATARRIRRGARPVITLVNRGKHPIQAYLKGPRSRSVVVQAGGSADVSLLPGKYQIAVALTGKAARLKRPLYGAQLCLAGVRYRLEVYGHQQQVGQARGLPKTGNAHVSRPAKPSKPADPSHQATKQRKIKQAIDRIRAEAHTALPPAESQYTNGPVGKGMTLENHSPFTFTFYFRGPRLEIVQVPAGRSVDAALVVGQYEIAAEAQEPPGVRIRPFYGRQTFQPDAHYWLKIYTRQVK